MKLEYFSNFLNYLPCAFTTFPGLKLITTELCSIQLKKVFIFTCFKKIIYGIENQHIFLGFGGEGEGDAHFNTRPELYMYSVHLKASKC